MKVNRRRAAVLAVLGTVLGGAVLLMGAGSAGAHTYPCSDTDSEDIYVNARDAYLGVDPGGSNVGWVWVCAAPTGGAGNQRWVLVTAGDPGEAGPGFTVQAGGCTGVVGGQGFPPGCTYLLEPTGVNVNPTPSLNLPADGNSTSGGAVDATTCTWVNDTNLNCPTTRLVGATVNEADAPELTMAGSGSVCAGVFINGTCVGTTVTVPGSVSVTVGGDPNNTVDVDVAGTTQSANIPHTTVPIL